jgi:hypothetical protein
MGYIQAAMRILFVADGRSQIALNWIGYFLAQGDDVHLVSSFPCAGDARLASFQVIPVALSGFKRNAQPESQNSGEPAASLPLQSAKSAGRRSRGGVWSASAVGFRTGVRQWLAPLTLPSAARRLHAVIDTVQPDLVHAMRIPYEGMLAALAGGSAPLLVSVWGNDFTLHAPATPWLARLTRQTLQRAVALHADCRRDVRLARDWGFITGTGSMPEKASTLAAFAPTCVRMSFFRRFRRC